MKTKVFFSSLKTSTHGGQLQKIRKLVESCGIDQLYRKNDLVAIKVHFGELGNTSYLRPVFLRPIVEKLKESNTRPYLTDTNTLYVGMRTNSVDHLHNANWNGFGYSTLQVPVIIADGLRGENTIDFPANLPLTKTAYLASDIVHADGMICVSHVKAHEVACIGGAIKNISMGCASRQGKLDMHSLNRPWVNKEICTACGRCVEACQAEAIEIQQTANITEKCTGCARCIAVCPEEAIDINWNETSDNVQRKMVEYAWSVIQSLKKKVVFVNIITSVSPSCDCYNSNDKPLVHDIGYMASLDPVAIDKASYDMIVKEAGRDVLQEKYPRINPDIQFQHARNIGLGTDDYELVTIL